MITYDGTECNMQLLLERYCDIQSQSVLPGGYWERRERVQSGSTPRGEGIVRKKLTVDTVGVTFHRSEIYT